MTPDMWLLIFCVFGLLVALGATSGIVNQLLWVSEPLTCVVAGIALGPLGAGLLHLDPMARAADAGILREAARFTLAIAVTGAAMRLPAYWLRQNWRGLAVALGPGMMLMDCVAQIRKRSEFGQLVSLLREADILRTSEIEHPVQCIDGNRDFGRPTLIGARP